MPCRGVIRLTDEQRDALIKSAHFPNHPTKEEVMEEEEEESQTQPFIDSLKLRIRHHGPLSHRYQLGSSPKHAAF